MPTITHRQPGGNPTVIRVYATVGNKPLIIDVPAGHLTTEYVAQAREAGGTRLRIVALDDRGRVVDKVVVR